LKVALDLLRDENSLRGSKAYLYYFDPHIQRTLRLSEQWIRRAFVVDCLMHDHLFTSLSHLLGSSVTTRVLENYPGVLAAGVVAIYVREFASVSDFVAGREARYEKERALYDYWHIELPYREYERQLYDDVPVPEEVTRDPEQIRDAKCAFLEEYLARGVSHSPLPGMGVYSRQLTNDFDPAHSPFRNGFGGFEQEMGRLHEFVRTRVVDRLNRSLLATAADRLIGDPAVVELIARINAIDYLLGYRANLGGDVLFSPEWGYAMLDSKYGTYAWHRMGFVITSAALGKALDQLMRDSRIAPEVLDWLTDTDILGLRESVNLRAYRALVEEIARRLQLEAEEVGSLHLVDGARHVLDDVMKEIVARAKTQRRALRRAEEVKRRLYHLCNLVAMGSAFAALWPPLWPLALAAGLPYFEPLIKRARRSSGEYPLVLLGNEIRRATEPGDPFR
jgi:hypothetical protein